MENERNWVKHVGGSSIKLSGVQISHAPNEHAPCYGCVFFKIGDEFSCTFPDDGESRECNPGFGASATVYKKKS